MTKLREKGKGDYFNFYNNTFFLQYMSFIYIKRRKLLFRNKVFYFYILVDDK